jgi:GNAT superfamily N-acetyltransferase
VNRDARIRPPRPDELEALRAIERDACRAFADVGMPEIAADEPFAIAELEAFLAAGRAWVAVDDDDRPVAYLVSDVVDGCAHVEQVSVVAAHAGRGLGATLIDHLDALARREGRAALTLTTFRDVPWNAPYYERLGFEPITPRSTGASSPRSSPTRRRRSPATPRAWRCAAG